MKIVIQLQFESEIYQFKVTSFCQVPIIAKQFCLQNDLDDECQIYIQEQIIQQIEEKQKILKYKKLQKEQQNISPQKNTRFSFGVRKQSKSSLKNQELENKTDSLNTLTDLDNFLTVNSKSEITPIIKENIHIEKSPQKSNSVFDNLYQNSKEKSKRRLQLSLFKKQYELKDCTFSPKIHDSSKTLDKNQILEVFPSVHERLYLQSKVDQEIKNDRCNQIFEQIYPFKTTPTNKTYKTNKIDQQNQVNKLSKPIKAQFQPSPRKQGNFKDKSIIQVFHNQKKNARSNPQLKEIIIMIKLKKNNSNQLLNKKQQKSEFSTMHPSDFLKKVFLKLDYSRNKTISNENCDVGALDERLLQIVKPVLNMIDLGAQIQFDQFVQTIENDHQSLDNLQRYIQAGLIPARQLTPKYRHLFQF